MNWLASSIQRGAGNTSILFVVQLRTSGTGDQFGRLWSKRFPVRRPHGGGILFHVHEADEGNASCPFVLDGYEPDRQRRCLDCITIGN